MSRTLLFGLALLVPACASALGSAPPSPSPPAARLMITATPPRLPPIAAPVPAVSANAPSPSLASPVCSFSRGGARRFPRDFAPRVPATPERIRQALAAVRGAFPDLLADLVLDWSDDQTAHITFQMRDIPSAYGRDGVDHVQRCITSELDRLDIPQLSLPSYQVVRSR